MKGDNNLVSDQKEIVEALMNPDAYLEETGQIDLKQTHISFIFMTENFVYKVKKAVNFGFLDFSSLEKRRIFCEKELELNKRLCGDMYLEVVPVTKSDVGTIKMDGDGDIIEYAVKMRRIPEEKIMTHLLEEGKVDENLVDRIAELIAEFHLRAKTNNRIRKFGSLFMIKKNWKENFEQTKELAGEIISQECYELIQERVENFMVKNASFFEKRVLDDRVRECHGDIHAGNIFVADRIYIFDAIEFNERFRYCDVASEIAFLAMDLDYKNRGDLARLFVEKYIQYSGDWELEKILPFYKCYRAYVRGKVTSFKINDLNVDRKDKIAAKKEAQAYFDLAAEYTNQF